MRRQLLRAWLAALACCGLAGCGDSSLDRARASYRQRHDYESLAFIQTHLAQGVPRERVLEWLGEPDFSSDTGKDEYASTSTNEAGAPLGLTIDYADGQGQLTDRVQRNLLGPILHETPVDRNPGD